MPIYTKRGDHGLSSLASGQPIAKSSPQIAACGAIDTAQAQLARCRALATMDFPEAEPLLTTILHKLSTGAAVASGYSGSNCRLAAPDVLWLEEQIDTLSSQAQLPHYIVIPGGHPLAIELNLARALVRQAELDLWQAVDGGALFPEELLQYFNRLSDLLFVMAGYINYQTGWVPERWQP